MHTYCIELNNKENKEERAGDWMLTEVAEAGFGTDWAQKVDYGSDEYEKWLDSFCEDEDFFTWEKRGEDYIVTLPGAKIKEAYNQKRATLQEALTKGQTAFDEGKGLKSVLYTIKSAVDLFCASLVYTSENSFEAANEFVTDMLDETSTKDIILYVGDIIDVHY